jgi:hypothetical protein
LISTPTLSQVQTVTLKAVSGVEFLGQTFNIFAKDTTTGNQIVDTTYNYNFTTPALNYRLPDNFVYTGYRQCSFTPKTIVAQTVFDLLEQYAERFKVQSEMWNFIDS